MKHKRVFGSIAAAAFLSAALIVSGCGAGASADGSAAESTIKENTSESTAENSTAQDPEKEDGILPQKDPSEAPAVSEETAAESAGSSAGTETSVSESDAAEAPQIGGLVFEEKTPLDYAECFSIYRYEGGYSLIDIPESGRFLVVPEGKEAPEKLPEDVRVLQQPLDRVYLAATSAMALFDAVDALDCIRMSGTQASGWYVEAAAAAMEAGEIIYAGKYSEPDYETLISEECDLAIESTMIYHTPKVKEMLEDLGIPVLVDRSSYESHPLGRTEWVKLYAVLSGKEAEADAFFGEQVQIIDELKDFENTGRTVAFFYISTDGSVVIRSPEDYISKMIEIGGAKYAFSTLKPTTNATSFSISMEEFYAGAVDADYLIYNGSIDSPLTGMDDLLAKSELFSDFKAVREGNVWTTGKSFYQATDIVGKLIRDINIMVTDGDEAAMTFLTKV